MQTPLSGERSNGPICSSRLTGWSAGVASKGSPGGHGSLTGTPAPRARFAAAAGPV